MMDGHQDKQNALSYMKKPEAFEYVSSMGTLFRSLMFHKQNAVNLQR